MAAAATRNPKQEFKELLTRKQMLQEVLQFADLIEQIHSGLNSALQMGKATNQIKDEVLRYYEGLKSMRDMPPAKLKTVLAQLEASMAKNIQRVVSFAESQLDDSAPPCIEEEAQKLINDFRRAANTALAMRLMLKEQGQITKPAKLPVDADALRERVEQMGEREKQVRVKVENEIVSIRDDSQRLLKTPGLPDSIRGMLEQTVSQMEVNLQHVREGRSFDSLPHAMEILEASQTPEIEEIPEVLPVAEVEELVVEEVELVDPGKPKKGGVSGQLNAWLNAPWDVGWDEAAKLSSKKKDD